VSHAATVRLLGVTEGAMRYQLWRMQTNTVLPRAAVASAINGLSTQRVTE
jgi:hypothetical protein